MPHTVRFYFDGGPVGSPDGHIIICWQTVAKTANLFSKIEIGENVQLVGCSPVQEGTQRSWALIIRPDRPADPDAYIELQNVPEVLAHQAVEEREHRHLAAHIIDI